MALWPVASAVVFAVAANQLRKRPALAPGGGPAGFLIWNGARRGCSWAMWASTFLGAVFRAGWCCRLPAVADGPGVAAGGRAVAADALICVLRRLNGPASPVFPGPSAAPLPSACSRPAGPHRRVCLVTGGNRADGAALLAGGGVAGSAAAAVVLALGCGARSHAWRCRFSRRFSQAEFR